MGDVLGGRGGWRHASILDRRFACGDELGPASHLTGMTPSVTASTTIEAAPEAVVAVLATRRPTPTSTAPAGRASP